MGGQTADTILLGNVLVLDRTGSTAEAIAIAGGRILGTGRRDAVMESRGPGTQVHDFGASTLIPGFNDTHAHSDSLGLKTLRPSLQGAKSIADILDRIRKLVAERKPGEWIVTMPIGEPPYYWDADKSLVDGRLPNRHDLDSVAPDNPVYISSPSGFWGEPPCFMILNSLALKLNSIDRSTRPRVNGVEIAHDGSGEPTGLIIERNYTRMAEPDLLPAVPRFSQDDRLEGLRRSLPMYHDKGTTSVYEGHGCAPDVVSSFRRLWEMGELTLRSSLVISPAWLGTA